MTDLARPAASCLGLLLGALPAAAAQELVPNASFEDHATCPAFLGELDTNPDYWSAATEGSPDWFHVCATTTDPGVPVNAFGSEPALSGEAYAGFFVWNSTSQIREFLQVPLDQPLTAGAVYEVRFNVSFVDDARYALDRLGAYVSVGPLTPPTNTHALTLTPHVESPAGTFLDEKNGWTLVQGLFVAAGGEDHLVLGNFHDDANTNTLDLSNGSFTGAYYYVDDVSVERCGEPAPFEYLYRLKPHYELSESATDVAVYAPCGVKRYVFATDPDSDAVYRYPLDGSSQALPYVFPPPPLPFASGPYGIAVNDLPGHASHGHVYVSEFGAPPFGRIYVYDTAGCWLAEIVVDSILGHAELVEPLGVALDERGDLYVADRALGLVYRFDAAVLAGVPGCGFGVGIPAVPATVYDVVGAGYPPPRDVTVDAAYRVHVSYENGTSSGGVVVFAPDGSTWTAGPPTTGSPPRARGVDAKGPFASGWLTTVDTLERADWDLSGPTWTPGPVIGQIVWTWMREGLESERYYRPFGISSPFRERPVTCEERLFSAGFRGVAVFGREHVSTPRPADAVAWWPFDEVQGPVADDLMSPVSATLSASPPPGRARGVVRCALRFAGTGDGASVPHRASLDFGTGSFTVEGWMRAELDGGVRTFLDKRSGIGAGYTMFLLNGHLGVQLNDGSTFENFHPQVPANLVADGRWHHFAVAVARGGSSPGTRLYVDGIHVPAMLDATPLPGSVSSGAPLWIGRINPSTFGGGLRGELDELTVYSRALAAVEIAGIACAGCAGKHLPPSLPNGGILHGLAPLPASVLPPGFAP